MSTADRDPVHCPHCGAVATPADGDGHQGCPKCGGAQGAAPPEDDNAEEESPVSPSGPRRVVLLGLKERRSRQEVRIRLAGLGALLLGIALSALPWLFPEARLPPVERIILKTILYTGYFLVTSGVVMLAFGILPASKDDAPLDSQPPPLRWPRADTILSIAECECQDIATGDELFARQTVHEGDVVGISRMASGPVKLVVVDPNERTDYSRLYRVCAAKSRGLFRLVRERKVRRRRSSTNPFGDLY